MPAATRQIEPSPIIHHKIQHANSSERLAGLSLTTTTDFAHHHSRSTSLSNFPLLQYSFAIGVMLSAASTSGTSAGRRDGQRQAPANSPAPVALPRTSEKEPPLYGAQHRQDALWKVGGNDALPPLWQQFQVSDQTVYQDDTLVIASYNRPLPGVRLGEQRKCYWERQIHDIT
ncbi:hypothetical protein P692DRAFT_20745256 [Suillus brevipes Sb2]|nr:hypothetical protein P692DRAFT_20745256 [Suillus brevipes Sb2]